MTASRLDEIASTHGIRLLLQFGSTVSGHVHARSDVDLAVVLERADPPLEDYAGLLHDLQGLFPGQDVDLAILNRADPLFLKQVTERCRLLHGARRDLERLKLLAFKRYQDHRRYLELERRFVAGAVAGGGARD
jgi:predicted nucleotidyltransferase